MIIICQAFFHKLKLINRPETNEFLMILSQCSYIYYWRVPLKNVYLVIDLTDKYKATENRHYFRYLFKYDLISTKKYSFQRILYI